MSRFTGVRFQRTTTQVFLRPTMEVAENVQDMAVDMAREQKQTRVSDATCYDALRLYKQVLGW